MLPEELIDILLNKKEELSTIEILKYRSQLVAPIVRCDADSLEQYLQLQGANTYQLDKDKCKSCLQAIGFECRSDHIALTSEVYDWQISGTEYQYLITHESIPSIAYTIEWHEDNKGPVIMALKEGSQTLDEQFSNFNYVLGWDSEEEGAWNSAIGQMFECMHVPWNVEDYVDY